MTTASLSGAMSTVPGHAYTLLGTHTVNAGQFAGERLVNIRNPWGKEEYKGPYCDKDAQDSYNTGKKCPAWSSNGGKNKN